MSERRIPGQSPALLRVGGSRRRTTKHPTSKAECSECHRLVSLRKDGQLRAHGETRLAGDSYGFCPGLPINTCFDEREETEVTFLVVSGPAGPSLYIDDYRIAGPKPWGGGQVVGEWKVKTDTVRRQLSQGDFRHVRS